MHTIALRKDRLFYGVGFLEDDRGTFTGERLFTSFASLRTSCERRKPCLRGVRRFFGTAIGDTPFFCYQTLNLLLLYAAFWLQASCNLLTFYNSCAIIILKFKEEVR